MPLGNARLIPLVPPVTKDEGFEPFRSAAETAGLTVGLSRVDQMDGTGVHLPHFGQIRRPVAVLLAFVPQLQYPNRPMNFLSQ